MLLEESRIRQELTVRRQRKLILYDELDSTNEAAKQLAKDGASHGTVVFARRQTAGKGRFGRKFYSPADAGIYMTVVLRPESMMPGIQVTPAAAIAVSRAIKTVCGIDTRIKWVNDVYWDGKKLCGILAEASVQHTGLQSIVLGIGINVNKSAYPPELRDVAVSLEEMGARNPDMNRLAGELLNQLDGCLSRCDYLEEYREKSCVLGKTVEVTNGSQVYQAVVRDIDGQFSLVIQRSDGRLEILRSGEIHIKGDFR